MLNIIVAYDEQRGIGFQGGLPWPPISEDWKHFKTTTLGRPVLMGRNTWDSLPKKPLPGRRNIVISRSIPSQDGIDVCRNLEEAVVLAGPDAFLIGGGQMYQQALDAGLVDRIVASEIKGVYPADTFFPPVSWAGVVQAEYDDFRVVVYTR